MTTKKSTYLVNYSDENGIPYEIEIEATSVAKARAAAKKQIKAEYGNVKLQDESITELVFDGAGFDPASAFERAAAEMRAQGKSIWD